MSWTDRFRTSGNIDDRRPGASKPAPVPTSPGRTAGTAATVGLLAGLLGYCGGQVAAPEQDVNAPADAAGAFVAHVLGDVEDRWKEILGDRYRAPKLTLYTRSTATKGCKTAMAAYGPFYCEQDERIYLDVSFFAELSTKACKKEGEPCEVARAHVIAHEFGHHVQKILGIFDVRHQGMSEVQVSVRTELQADCFAGIWLGRSNQKWRNIKPEFLLAAQEVAQFGGDGPYGRPSHGTGKQRAKWLMNGYRGKELAYCDTFTGDL